MLISYRRSTVDTKHAVSLAKQTSLSFATLLKKTATQFQGKLFVIYIL